MNATSKDSYTKQINAATNEQERLTALESYGVLDTPAEQEFDALTQLAAYICGSPIALISLIDAERQWFKSKQGLEVQETPRNIAFCRFTIESSSLLEVPDANMDERFVNNPLVTGDPHIRHYCGAPLVTPEGFQLGSLCVIDQVPKTLLPQQKQALQTLAQEVVTRLELNRQKKQLQWQKQQLEHSEKLFKSLFENSAGYLYTHDLTGTILSVNPAAAQALQYDRAELAGKPLSHFLAVPETKAYQTYFEQLQRGQVVSDIVKIRTARQEERFWLYRNFVYEDSESGPYVICSAHDVTEKEEVRRALRQTNEELELKVRNRTEELLATNTALQKTSTELDTFLYRASHDLKGPLCSLSGLLQLSQLDNSFGSGEQYLNMMRQTVFKLEQVLDSILTYSNNTQYGLQYEPVDFVAVVEQAIDGCLSIKGFGRVRLEKDIQMHGPFVSDSERIRIVIKSLLANSIIFQNFSIKDPLIQILVRSDEEKATITLIDNGIGIPAEKLSTIFEMFSKSSAQSMGAGLGLYIVKEVLRKLQGTISVQSNPGENTVFMIAIPNQLAEQP